MSDEDHAPENEREFDERLRAVSKIEGRYDLEAYRFIFDALHFTISSLPQPRHVTAAELLDGLRELAKKKFGFMARVVFENWGVHRTSDFGEIVFGLVNYGLMGKTEEDSIEDFDEVYDFKKVFDDEYLKELPMLVSIKA
jgi:uncharacterized repeat protein (TIGR04138 family)